MNYMRSKRQMRILVVEDNIQWVEMLTEVLIDCQYAVDVARDRGMTRNWVSTWEDELLVLDLTLPKPDGMKLCQRLRQKDIVLPLPE